MPCCVLRAVGDEFDPESFLANSPFNPCKVFKRDDPIFLKSEKVCRQSGFHLEVSSAGGNQIPMQICEAVAFLKSNREELQRLVNWPGVKSAFLDFGWDFPCERTYGQFNRFPLELLKDCASLGLEIEVSVYATSET